MVSVGMFTVQAYNWFKDYVYDRQQFVSISGINSDTAPVLYRVPQGSVLGPLLFLIYVNDIYSCIDDATVKLFADDTNSFVRGQFIDDICHCQSQAERQFKPCVNGDMSFLWEAL